MVNIGVCMRRHAKILVAVLSLVASVVASVAVAQSSGGEYAITKNAIAGGGGSSSGGEFVLSGTIGQSEASTQTAEGGDFQLTGGFWAESIIVPAPETIFANGFETP